MKNKMSLKDWCKNVAGGGMEDGICKARRWKGYQEELKDAVYPAEDLFDYVESLSYLMSDAVSEGFGLGGFRMMKERIERIREDWEEVKEKGHFDDIFQNLKKLDLRKEVI